MRYLGTAAVLLFAAIVWKKGRGRHPSLLPWSDVNVLIDTDVHSYLERGTTDYGKVLSFYERLKQDHPNLLFVMNGDWMDGTGLALSLPSLTPLLQRVPWDVVTLGNHELYRSDVLETMLADLIPHWGDRFVTSNVHHAGTKQSVGRRFRIVQRVLCFGFLVQMSHPTPLVEIQLVQDAVQEDWFREVLLQTGDSFDSILVLAHMDAEDPDVIVLLQAIREFVGATLPVLFVTGHTHRRAYVEPDASSASFQAGHYLDTIGFASYSLQGDFHHVFVDPEQLSTYVGTTLDTPNGTALSRAITETRDSLGLTKRIGCVPSRSLLLNTTVDAPNSLWKFVDEVLAPSFLSPNQVLLLSKGNWAVSLHKGHLTVDDLIRVAPYNSTLMLWKGLAVDDLHALVATLNENPDTSYLPWLPMFLLLPSKRSLINDTYEVVLDEFEVPIIRAALERMDSAWGRYEPERTNWTTTNLWIDFFEAANMHRLSCADTIRGCRRSACWRNETTRSRCTYMSLG